jgi:hypothetical protein
VTGFCRDNSCGFGGSVCDPASFCPGGSHDPWVVNDLEDLATLRAELQETLSKLDALETTLPSGIQSLAHADELTRALKDVADQVSKTAKRLKLK